MIPFVLPMGLFCLLLAVPSACEWFDATALKSGHFWLTKAEHWVYPLQTLLCGGALFFFRRSYTFDFPKAFRNLPLVVGVGLLVFALWVFPAFLPGAKPRLDGFDPTLLAESPSLYILAIVFRLLRLVVVVPFMEEIFWRGFLQRYLIKEAFEKVPFGSFTPVSFFGVAAAFMLVHHTADWPAAFLCGLLYGLIACHTKSLGGCVLVHAVTNLLLGTYILMTRQWGFW